MMCELKKSDAIVLIRSLLDNLISIVIICVLYCIHISF